MRFRGIVFAACAAMPAFAWAQGVIPTNNAAIFSAQPVQPSVGLQSHKLSDFLGVGIDIKYFGAIGNGSQNELSSINSFGGQNTTGWTLAQWQTIFPFATALTNDIDGLAIQAAINATDKIAIGDGTYEINTTISLGTKSIYWNISPNATFSDSSTAGAFPTLITNSANVANGPWIISNSTEATPSNGATDALAVETTQESGNNQAVALYTGAASNQTTGNIWGMNSLVNAGSAFTGAAYGLEIDVNSSATSTSSAPQGILVTGSSSGHLENALSVAMIGSSQWNIGLNVQNSLNGIYVNSSSTGLEISGSPANGLLLLNKTSWPNVIIAGEQIANNDDTVILQRATDTSPTGYFERFVNNANSASLWSVDINGNVNTPGNVTVGNNVIANYVVSSLPAKINNIAIGTTPSVATLGTNPPVSGTAYQWAGPGTLQLACPITYSPTSTAAATSALDIGSTSTPSSAVDTESEPAGITAGMIHTAHAEVPSGWYYELTATNATIGTCVGVVH